MKVSKPEDIRNIALLSHGSVGKTSLLESMLFHNGAINRLGKVEEGTTASDFTPEEKNKGISINATYIPIYRGGIKFNMIDTPGYIDFIGDVHGALRVVDSAIVMVCAASGVEVNTHRVWKMADDANLPRLVFINKMDRESADFRGTLSQVQENFGSGVIPLFIPMGSEDNFKGVIDLFSGKAHVYEDWGKYKVEDIPAEYVDDYEEFHMEMVETLAEVDDELMMKYLEEEELSKEELENALEKGVREGKLMPVFAGSANKGMGVDEILNLAPKVLPSPVGRGPVKGVLPDSEEETARKPSLDEPTCALVAKTMVDPYVGRLSIFRVFSGKITIDSEIYNANKEESEKIAKLYNQKGKDQENVEEVIAGDIGAVAKLQHTGTGDTLCEKENPIILPQIKFPKPNLSLAAYPKGEGDEDKISTALNRFAEEDPTFNVFHDPETNELVVSGMGTMHLDIVKDVSKRKFGVDFETTAPKIAYKETIQKKIEVEEKHKKQTGGRGQYGHVHIRLEPMPRGSGFEFKEEIFGGAIPNQFIPGVEKGVREAMKEGVIAGYHVVDFKATVFDGSYHPVDSSEMAFKLAASKAFKKAVENADPVLLEPIMEVRVEVSEEQMGDVIGDLNSKRGKILGMDPQDGLQIIKANVPLAEMANYANDLKSITGGQGTFSMKVAYYDKVPPRETEQIIAKSKKDEE